MTKLLYTAEEAAEALGVSRSTFYLLLAAGDVASVKIGALRRVSASALDQYVARLSEQNATLTPEPDHEPCSRCGRHVGVAR